MSINLSSNQNAILAVLKKSPTKKFTRIELMQAADLTEGQSLSALRGLRERGAVNVTSSDPKKPKAALLYAHKG